MRNRFPIWIVGLALLLNGESFAARPSEPTRVVPSPSPSSVDLLLPSYEVERLNAPGKENVPVRVGDVVDLQIQNLPPALSLDSTTDIEEQGWTLESAKLPLLKVSPLKTGNQTLPSFTLKDAAGKNVGRTRPFTLDIKSAISPSDPRPSEPEDIEPPIGVPYPTWIVVLGSLLGIALLGGGIYLLIRWFRKRKKNTPKQVEIVLPEDEVALIALADLEKQSLLEKGQFKTYYFRFSEIVKAYVGARYRMDALESTSREMMNLLEEKRAASDHLLDQLESIFSRLDLVKFTDHVPNPSEGGDLLVAAREFIRSTRRVPSIVEASGVPTHAVR